ncbi:hypothetical protein MST22_15550 [Virgibacillus halodenitrificans]|uniref:hypothetical protein n=1 Tax=Virgibacillus halodenitrificans TaxID=1482 RepID=UPI001FB45808|nr:hypothetical protein [Virgibacillus halodenitrificans]MCJ0932562.1 hypothetical protein [Virgibacillus halodenitrificans]
MTVEETIQERQEQIDSLTAQLKDADPKQVKKIEKEIKKLEKANKKAEFWNNAAKKTESTGQKFQETGKAMQKAGLKTTAAVWTPAIYVGYKVIKKQRNKNETPEQELISLIKECEQAYKSKQIDEETMKSYIADYVNNHYREE